MPHPYSPTSRIDPTVAPPIPDGPVGSASTWRSVLDARAFAGLLSLAVPGRARYAHVSGSSSTVFTVTVAPLTYVVQQGTDWRVVQSTIELTAGLAQVDGAPASLSATTWYHVYAKASGGLPVLEISDTAPDNELAWKSGTAAQTHRYLWSFRTDGSGVPMSARMTNGVTRYRTRQSVLGGGSATTNTSVIVRPSSTTEEPLVPPFARVALLSVTLTHGTDAATRQLTLTHAADASNVAAVLVAANLGGVSYQTQMETEVELNNSRAFGYAIDSASGSAFADAYCNGWRV